MKKSLVHCQFFLFYLLIGVSPCNHAVGIELWNTATFDKGDCKRAICYVVTCGTGTTGAQGHILTMSNANGPITIQVSKPGFPPKSKSDPKPLPTDPLMYSLTDPVKGGQGKYNVKVFTRLCFKDFDHLAKLDCIKSSEKSSAFKSLSPNISTVCN